MSVEVSITHYNNHLSYFFGAVQSMQQNFQDLQLGMEWQEWSFSPKLESKYYE